MLEKFLSSKRAFRITMSILVLIPLLITIVVWFINQTPEPIERGEEGSRYLVRKPVSAKENIQVFGSQREFVLMNTGENFKFRERYALTTEQKVLVKKDGEELKDDQTIPKSDYWKVYLYDLEKEGLPAKKIDLNKVIENYDSNYYPIDFGIAEYRNDPQNILFIKIKNGKNPNDIQELAYNLDVNKIEGQYQKRSDTYDRVDMLFSATSFYEYIKAKGYLVQNTISNYSNVNQTQLDMNINLFSEYPEAKEKIANDDWTLFPRDKYVTSEDWFNTVLHWMAPIGEEKLTIYGVDKNGQVTDKQLATYADYQAWIQEQESERSQDETN